MSELFRGIHLPRNLTTTLLDKLRYAACHGPQTSDHQYFSVVHIRNEYIFSADTGDLGFCPVSGQKQIPMGPVGVQEAGVGSEEE